MRAFKSPRRRYARILQLEAMLQQAPLSTTLATPEIEEEWLEAIHRMGQTDLFAKETDFPWLLQRFERAVNVAQASRDPSFYPPRGYETHLLPSARLQMWRSSFKFPEVHRTFMALLDMCVRAMSGQPPLLRAEWERLKTWYLRVRDLLPFKMGALTLPTGKIISTANIAYGLDPDDGLIVDGTERAMHLLRELHEHYGAHDSNGTGVY